MTDRDALYRAIVANPEEDVPRLAFADAIEEDGESEYAEFIRSQCELARLEDDGSDSQTVYQFLAERDAESLAATDWQRIDAGVARRVELARRVKQLVGRDETAWSHRLPAGAGLKWSAFRRGFQSFVSADSMLAIQSFCEDGLHTELPAFTLTCDDLDPQTAEMMIDGGVLRSLSGLHLRGACVDALRVLGRSPDAAGVRSLDVQTRQIDGAARLAEVLAGSPHWAGLRHLDLSQMLFPSDSAKELFRAPHLRGLTRLMLGGGVWDVDTARTFAAAKFTSLVELRLTGTEFTGSGLTDAEAEILADCPSLGNLRSLDLCENQIGGRGASAILASRRLPSLAFVSFQSNRVRGLDRAMLANAPPGGLRVFHGHGCNLTVADVRALTRSPRLDALWYLDLDDNGLGTGAVREVVRGLGERCPPILWMIGNRINADGAGLLANWPHAPRLQVLMLQNNSLTDDGVKGLLASPKLKNLRGLGVSDVGERVGAEVRTRFGDHAIVR